MPKQIYSLLVAGLLLTTLVGCQSGPTVQTQRLIQHQAMIDFSGLKAPALLDAVRVQASLPASWNMQSLEQKPLYTHQQWKSPSLHTGVGVIYVRLPLPLGTPMLIWAARQQFTQQQGQGHEMAEWTDELGRRWFEAETPKYHARGYAMVNGLDAWIVYFGYKVNVPPDPAEISEGIRSLETFIPVRAGEKPVVPTTMPSVPQVH